MLKFELSQALLLSSSFRHACTITKDGSTIVVTGHDHLLIFKKGMDGQYSSFQTISQNSSSYGRFYDVQISKNTGKYIVASTQS